VERIWACGPDGIWAGEHEDGASVGVTLRIRAVLLADEQEKRLSRRRMTSTYATRCQPKTPLLILCQLCTKVVPCGAGGGTWAPVLPERRVCFNTSAVIPVVPRSRRLGDAALMAGGRRALTD